VYSTRVILLAFVGCLSVIVIETGDPMETPFSGSYKMFSNTNRKMQYNTISEIFLQYIEDTYLKQLLDTKNIILYTRYVDDVLLIYDKKCINSNTFHEYINQIHPNLQLNPTHENNNCINFLDLLII